MSDERELLRRTAEIAADFIDTLAERPVFPNVAVEDLAAALGGPLPDGPTDPLEVVEAMAGAVDPGIVATAGPRYFGYVTGGALPADDRGRHRPHGRRLRARARGSPRPTTQPRVILARSAKLRIKTDRRRRRARAQPRSAPDRSSVRSGHVATRQP